MPEEQHKEGQITRGLQKRSTVVYNERMMSSAVAQKIVKRHTVHNRESVAKREHQALLILVA